MAELLPTQDEAEWLEARRKGITASEISIIMGLSPWSSPYKLYHQKLGILPRDEVTPAMERGTYLEPYVAGKFAEAHPELKVEGDGRQLYAHSERLWQLATLDRKLYAATVIPSPPALLVWHFTEVLEVKTTTDMSEWGEPGTDEIPVHYRAQVLWQMDVMGVDRAHVAVLDIGRWEVREYVISHDESPVIEYPHDIPGPLAPGICRACGDIEVMRAEGEAFLGRLARKQVPDVDYRPATAYALKQLHPSVEDRHVVVPAALAKRYRAACKAAKAAEQRKALAENLLRQRLGAASAAYDGATGQPLATRQVYDVAAKTIERKAFTVDKLTPVKPKKES